MTVPPRRIHFVWTGPFPYYARLAVESAVVAMPDADVTVHLGGDAPWTPHLRRVERSPGVRIVRIDEESLFDGCPGGSGAYRALLAGTRSPAAFSNLVRLAVLRRDGGVYIDADVLVLRPVHDPRDHGAFVGCEWVWSMNRRRIETGAGAADVPETLGWAAEWLGRRIDARFGRGVLGLANRPLDAPRHRLQVNNAVIGAPPGAAFIRRSLERALEVDPSVRFALGPSLLDDVVREGRTDVAVLPPSRFYAVPPSQSYRYFEDRSLQLCSDAQLIHVVASNHRRLLAQLSEDDRRFERHNAPYWRYGRSVRIAIADRRRAHDRPSVVAGSR